MAKKLSFILPIYKVEDYLPQCVDSILSQTTDDCEIILVDDGSPDNCGAICDGYAAKYDNIRVIHKENGGLASARNAGLQQAGGEYVLFVDSDDYIEPGSLAKILDWADTDDADIVFLQCRKVYPDGSGESLGENLIRSEIRGKEPLEVLRFLAGCPKFPGSACFKIYRRGFLQKNGLRFPDDRRLSEDLQFALDTILAAEKFDCLDFPYYCYRQERAGSICNTVSARYYFDTFRFVEESAARLGYNQKAVDETAALALSFVAYEYAILLWQLLDMEGEDRVKALGLLKQYQWVLNYGRSGRTKLVRMAAALLGLTGAAKLLAWYMRRR